MRYLFLIEFCSFTILLAALLKIWHLRHGHYPKPLQQIQPLTFVKSLKFTRERCAAITIYLVVLLRSSWAVISIQVVSIKKWLQARPFQLSWSWGRTSSGKVKNSSQEQEFG